MNVYVRRWDEEVIKWLAVGMVLAMVGIAVMPAVGVGDARDVGQYHFAKTGKLTPEASLAISLAAVWHSAVWGAAAGMASGAFVGAAVGAAIGV